jgi:hypothetical protein
VAETQAVGYLYRRELDDGREIVVYPMLFTTRVCIGPTGEGYDRAWCYPNQDAAVAAADRWGGEGDPPGGWIKEVGTSRRRVDGTAATEFDE